MMYDTRQPADFGSPLGSVRGDRPLSPSYVQLALRNEPKPRAPSPLNPNHRRSSSTGTGTPAQHQLNGDGASPASPGASLPGDPAFVMGGSGDVPSGRFRVALARGASLHGKPLMQEGQESHTSSQPHGVQQGPGQQHGGQAGPGPVATRKLPPLRPKAEDFGPGSPRAVPARHASRFTDEVPASPGRSSSRRKSLDSGSWNVATAAGIFPDIVPPLRGTSPVPNKPEGQDSADGSNGAGHSAESSRRTQEEGLSMQGHRPRRGSMDSGAWRLPAMANMLSDLIPSSPRRAHSPLRPSEETAKTVGAGTTQTVEDRAVLRKEATGSRLSRRQSMDSGAWGISAAANLFSELIPSSPRRAPSLLKPKPGSAAQHDAGALGAELASRPPDQVPSSPRKALLKFKADAIFGGFGPGSARRSTGVPAEMMEDVSSMPRRSNSLVKVNSGAWDLAASSGLLEDMVPRPAPSKRSTSLLKPKASMAGEAGTDHPDGTNGIPAMEVPSPRGRSPARLKSKQGDLGDGQPDTASKRGLPSPASGGRWLSPLRPQHDVADGATGTSVQGPEAASAARLALASRGQDGGNWGGPGGRILGDGKGAPAANNTMPDGGSCMPGSASTGASSEIPALQRPLPQDPVGPTPSGAMQLPAAVSLGSRVRGPSPLRPRLEPLVIQDSVLERENTQRSARSQGGSPVPERRPSAGFAVSPMHRFVLEGSLSMSAGQGSSPPVSPNPVAVTGEKASSLPGKMRFTEDQSGRQDTLGGRPQGPGTRTGGAEQASDLRTGEGGQASPRSLAAVSAWKQQRRLQMVERQDSMASTRSAYSGKDIVDTFLSGLEPAELQPTFLRGLSSGSVKARREAWEGGGGRDTDSVCSEDVVLMSLEQEGEDEEEEEAQCSRSAGRDVDMAAAQPHVKTVVRKQLGGSLLVRTISSFGSGRFSVKEITNEEDELNADMGLPLVGSTGPVPSPGVEPHRVEGHGNGQNQVRPIPRHPHPRLLAEGSRPKQLPLKPHQPHQHHQGGSAQGPGVQTWAQAGPAAGAVPRAALEDDVALFSRQDTSKSTVSVQCRMDADGSGYYAELDDDTDAVRRAAAGTKEVDLEDWGRTLTEIFVLKRGQPGALSRRQGRERVGAGGSNAVDCSRSRSEVEIDKGSTSSVDSARLAGSAPGSARLANAGPDSARLAGVSTPFMVPEDTLLEYDASSRSRRKQQGRRREQVAEPVGPSGDEEGMGTLERPGRVHRLGRGR